MKKCKKCNIPLEGTFFKILKTAFKVTPSKENTDLCNRCATKKKTGTYICQICDRPIDEATAITHIKAEEYILSLIKKDHPEWKEDKNTCHTCVSYYRELIKKAKL